MFDKKRGLITVEAQPEGTLGQASFPFTLEARGRHYPPGGKTDTIVGGRVTNDLSRSGLMLFRPEEILSVITSPYEKTRVTPYGTHLVPQVGMRGCTAACTEMLILDHGKKADLHHLMTSNIGTARSIITRLNQAGLKAESSDCRGPDVVFKLQEALDRHGPLILSIGNLGPNATICGDIGGHDLILDKILRERNSAIVRDPFHGWQIEVLLSAIVRQNPCHMIQVTGRIEGITAPTKAAATETEELPLFEFTHEQKPSRMDRLKSWFRRR